MRRLKARLLTALALSIAVPASAQEPAFPKDWQGIWNDQGERCLAKDLGNNDRLLQISGRTAHWYESQCDLKEITPSPEDPGALDIRLLCAGEGYEWTAAELWKHVAVDGNRFLLAANPERKSVSLYRRCE